MTRVINQRIYPMSRKEILNRGDFIKLSVIEDGNDTYLEDKIQSKKMVCDCVSILELVKVPGFRGTCRAIIYGEME